MNHRVFWSPHAEQRLEEMLFASSDATAIAASAREIDRHLVLHPKSFGESRYDTVRVGFVRPLGVQFEVLEDVRTVIVYEVWRIDRKA